MDELFCRTSDSPHVHAIPDMISAELRQIVRKALESLERDILVELDKFLKPSGIPSKARAQMWAGLWQLIFVFKGLTKTFHEAGDPMRNSAPRLLRLQDGNRGGAGRCAVLLWEPLPSGEQPAGWAGLQRLLVEEDVAQPERRIPACPPGPRRLS